MGSDNMGNFMPPEEVKERLPVIPLGIALNPVDAFENALRVKGLADYLVAIARPRYSSNEKNPFLNNIML